MKLALAALTKYLLGLTLVGALLFIPAGTLSYPNAYLFIALLFLPMLILGIVLLIKAPALLEKRLRAKEAQSAQRGVVAVGGLMFIGGFAVAGLDHRFGWSSVPAWAVAAASAVLLVSYVLYAEVMRENAYLSRTVEIQQGQQVIDTGLYGIVRHPMYAVTLWLFLAIPVVLGSWWALLCFVPYLPMLAVRILNEEKLLSRELVGYADYQKRVKYRLILFIW
ncbi:MAG: isoprenylcysteine carboxylmethyltransferase family protein [Ruminococcaceae bacterium]|nr:isoprenylcysteine carboxylmethyltransferase family protein [Oscillospiraceae bacterium]